MKTGIITGQQDIIRTHLSFEVADKAPEASHVYFKCRLYAVKQAYFILVENGRSLVRFSSGKSQAVFLEPATQWRNRFLFRSIAIF